MIQIPYALYLVLLQTTSCKTIVEFYNHDAGIDVSGDPDITADRISPVTFVLWI